LFICSNQNLAFIAGPKTGTTAIKMALRPKADIIFGKHRKHMPARRFHDHVAPMLADVFGIRTDRFAVMHAPEEQIRSWYRYRARDSRTGSPNSIDGITFDQLVRDAISDDPPPYAVIGSQWNMLTGN